MDCFEEKVAEGEVTKITLVDNNIIKLGMEERRGGSIMKDVDKKGDLNKSFKKGNTDVVDFQMV